MQDFDTLRGRVESTTQKLVSAQADRESQTDSLVSILRQLGEKHSAQSQQLAYYQTRLEPLEQANQQLTSLMESLLDMIDRGFGEESLAPLRDASEMAAAMLRSDLFADSEAATPAEDDTPAELAPETDSDVGEIEGEDVLVEVDAAPETDEELELAPVEAEVDTDETLTDAPEEEAPDIQDAAAEPEEVAELDDLADAAEEDEFAGQDLEMEEDALISMDELLDLASDDPAEEVVAFEEIEAMDPAEPAGAEAPDTTVNAEVAEAAADAVMEAMDDAAIDAELLADEPPEAEAAFEDVSDAVLELETEEDAAAGVDDLPDVVRDAMAEFNADDEVDLVPEIPNPESDAVAQSETDEGEDDLQAIAALAQAIEEETASEDAAPPAQSDIRALLLRVEALAKKAEAMRLAQGTSKKKDAAAESETDSDAETPKQAGAAA